MVTRIYTPTYPLSQFIDHFFYYTGFTPEHAVERFLPDGEVQMIFDLTDDPKYIYDNITLQEIQTCKKVWFSGFRTEPITIPSGRESEMLIVQFKMGKASPFLIEPMHKLTDFVVDGELVMNPEILVIRERLQEYESPQQKFHCLENQLLKIYIRHLRENSFVEFAVSSIVAEPGQSSIKAISEKAGYSQKHIIKLFKDHVGVTPKEFLKVIRFQKAIQQIERQKAVDWSAVAHDCGFYDQSHFIADFKLFSGYTPTAYLEQKGTCIKRVPV